VTREFADRRSGKPLFIDRPVSKPKGFASIVGRRAMM